MPDRAAAATNPRKAQSPGGATGAPVLGWLRGYRAAWLGADALAGITLAAVAIPEAMGYTKIAGMPVVTGIYTVVLPVLAFAILGSSRRLVVGADSATAAILFASLTALAPAASPRYVQLAGVTALLAGGMLLVARVLRLGFLADFLSRTALVGFLTGVGIQVAIGQLPDLLGVDAAGDTLHRLAATAQALPHAHLPTLLLGVLTFAGLVLLERVARRIPAALVAVVAGIVAGALWLEGIGVHTVGHVPGGFPPLGVPPFETGSLPVLAGVAGSIFIVVLAQSAATARSFAQRHDEPLDEDQDLVGLAFASAAAGFSGTFPVNGSPTKTAVVDLAGNRTQLAHLVAAALAVVVLLFAGGVLSLLPQATLAAIVFLIGVKLVDVHHLRELWRLRRDELVVAVLTAAVVVVVGVEPGILLAVALSILDYVRRGYHPKDAVMRPRNPGEPLIPQAATPGVVSLPGVLVYRFEAGLFFANSDYFAQRVQMLVRAAPSPLRWLVLDLSAVNDVDYTAGRVLRQVIGDFRQQGLTVALAHAEDVMDMLVRYGILDLVGRDHVYHGLREATAVAAERTGRGQPPDM